MRDVGGPRNKGAKYVTPETRVHGLVHIVSYRTCVFIRCITEGNYQKEVWEGVWKIPSSNKE